MKKKVSYSAADPAPQALRDKAKALRAENKPVGAIASTLGVSKSTILRWLYGRNRKTPPGERFKRPPNPRVQSVREKAVALHAEGKTYPEIAALLNMTRQRVAYYVQTGTSPSAEVSPRKKPDADDLRAGRAVQREQAMRMLAEGKKPGEVADAFGISYQTVWQWQQPSRTLPGAEEARARRALRQAKAKRLFAEGQRAREIAQALGVSEQALCQWKKGGFKGAASEEDVSATTSFHGAGSSAAALLARPERLPAPSSVPTAAAPAVLTINGVTYVRLDVATAALREFADVLQTKVTA